MSKLKRFSIIFSLVCFIFVGSVNTVRANAVVPEIAMSGELGSTALLMGVTAPEILVVAGLLIAGGVIFANKDELMDICGSIIAGGGVVTMLHNGSVAQANASKVKQAYDSYVSSHTVSINSVPTSALLGQIYNPGVGYSGSLILPNHDTTVSIPNGGGLSIGRSFFTGSITFNFDKGNFTATDSKGRVAYVSSSLYPKTDYYSVTGMALYYKDGNQFIGNNSLVLQKLGIPIYSGGSISAKLPTSYSPCKDLGNDTFATAPTNESVSLDKIVNATAPQVAEANPSLNFGNGSVAIPNSGSVSVPMGKVLNPDGSLDIGQDGTLNIPKDTTVDTTGDTTGEGTTTGDTTGERTGVNEKTIEDGVTNSLDKPITNTIDWSPILELGKKFTDVFPFCIPFDLIHSFKVLVVPSIPPKFNINFDSHYFVGGGSIDIDLTKFSTIAEVFRFLETLGFVVFLILKTRDLIRA